MTSELVTKEIVVNFLICNTFQGQTCQEESSSGDHECKRPDPTYLVWTDVANWCCRRLSLNTTLSLNGWRGARMVNQSALLGSPSFCPEALEVKLVWPVDRRESLLLQDWEQARPGAPRQPQDNMYRRAVRPGMWRYGTVTFSLFWGAWILIESKIYCDETLLNLLSGLFTY